MNTGTIEQALHEGAGAEMVAGGRAINPFKPAPKCEHRRVGLDGLTAVINDERGELEHREVRVRVRCMDCGIPMRIDLDHVRRPKDGEAHGIVLVVTPLEDE